MEIIVHEGKTVQFNPELHNKLVQVNGETLNGQHLEGTFFVRTTQKEDTIQLVDANREWEVLLDDFLFQQDKLQMQLMQ